MTSPGELEDSARALSAKWSLRTTRSEIWLDIIFFTSSVLWSLYFLFSDIWAYGSSHPLGYLLARKYEVASEAATG
jgi:hypothetical protein